jgi:hypothetical protein
MAQRTDSSPSIPESSVVDAEALRALRAVQRLLVQGGDAAPASLVGGTVAAGGLGAVRAEAHGAVPAMGDTAPPSPAAAAPPPEAMLAEGGHVQPAPLPWPELSSAALPLPLSAAPPMRDAAAGAPNLSFTMPQPLGTLLPQGVPPPATTPAVPAGDVTERPPAIPPKTEHPATPQLPSDTPLMVPRPTPPTPAVVPSLSLEPDMPLAEPSVLKPDEPSTPSAAPQPVESEPLPEEPPVVVPEESGVPLVEPKPVPEEPPVVVPEEPSVPPVEPKSEPVPERPPVVVPEEPGMPPVELEPVPEEPSVPPVEPPVVVPEEPSVPPVEPEPVPEQPPVVVPEEPSVPPVEPEPVPEQPPVVVPEEPSVPPVELEPVPEEPPVVVPEEPGVPPVELEPVPEEPPVVVPEEPSVPPVEPEPVPEEPPVVVPEEPSVPPVEPEPVPEEPSVPPVEPEPQPELPPQVQVPVVAASDVTGLEDAEIVLHLSAALNDVDGSESLSVSILGLPDGAMLSTGTRQADGGWLVSPADLPGLTLTPPADFAGTLELTLRATAREITGDTASSDSTFEVRVVPVVDGAVLAGLAAGSEDQWITLDVSFGTSPDASESWDARVLVHALPAGAMLSQGEDLGGGTWAVDRAALAAGQVAILPPADSDASIALRLEAVMRDTDGGGAERSIEAPLLVQVSGLADAPLVMVAAAAGREDTGTSLDFSAALADLDGSEALSVSILGLPDGATLSAGARQADGSWLVSPGDLAGLNLRPPQDFSGTLNLTLRATAQEASGDTASSEAGFAVTVAPVADAAKLVAGGEGGEDSWIPLRGSLALGDADGSEYFGDTLVVRGMPAGALLSHGQEVAPGVWEVPLAVFQSGLLAVLPPPDSDADLRLAISVTTIDEAGGLQDRRETEAEVNVVVRAAADAPIVTVADVQGQEDTLLRLAGLGGALRDTDGSESLSFLLSGLPSGASLSSVLRQSDGSWRLTPQQLATVSLAPPAQFSGSFTLTLTAVATEAADGQPSARTAASFTVSLDPVLDNGTIGGKVTGREDTAIALKPSFSTPDADGSETWSEVSRVDGVPAGAVLSQGMQVSPGVWDVLTAELRAGRISVTPPPDSDADFTLTITATLSDTGSGKTVSRAVAGSYAVTVTAVADAPVVSAANASGFEDQPVPLSLSAALRDTDGSETLGLSVLGLPAGAALSRGSRAADGTWMLSPADLDGLTLTPPRDFSGTIALTFRAVSLDHDNSTAVTTAAFAVQVQGVADAPQLRTGPVAGDEDSAIALHATALATDLDGSESVLAFRLADVPEGAVVRAGGAVLLRQADGSVLVSPADMGSLTITPPPHSDRDFTLRISAISAEPNGSQAESLPLDLPVYVHAVADAPVITGTGGQGLEDTAVQLDLSAVLVDADGSETLSFLVSGLPAGARLSAGTFRGHGAWSLTAEEAQHVSLLPPKDFAGTLPITVTAIAQEGNGGSQARSSAVLPVRIEGVIDAPAVGGLDGHSGDWGRMTGAEDQPIALRLDPGLRDADGSERVVGLVTLGGVPEGAVLRLADGTVLEAGADGLHRLDAARMAGVTLTLPRDSDAAAALSIRMTVEDASGARLEIGGTMLVEAGGVADAPLLVVRDIQAPGHADTDPASGWVPLPVEAALVDTDGSERLWLWVRDLPPGFTLSTGHPAGTESWLVPAEAISGLSIRPPTGFTGEVALRLEAMAVERGGDQATTGGLLRLTVTPEAGGGGGDAPGDGGGSPTAPDAPGTPDDPGILGGSPPAAAPPLLQAEAEVGLEDSPLALRVTLAGGATDGRAEALGLRVEGLPPGASLSAGLRDPATGAWVVVPDALVGLTLAPPGDFSGTLHLTLRALAMQPDGTLLTIEQALDVTVAPVADAALITARPAAGVEDVPLALNLQIAPADADGSESLASVLLSGLSQGARIAAGAGITDLGDGTWSVEPAHLAEVMLVPPEHASGEFRLTVTAVTMEAANGATRATAQDVAVSFAPVAQAPLLQAADAAGREDQPIALDLGAALVDGDGSEILTMVLEGLPDGARLSAGVNNGDGSWTLTPAQLAGLTLTPPGNWSGRMDLTLVAHAMEGADASYATSRAAFVVEVEAVADRPMLDVAATLAGNEDTVLALDLRARLTDGDGSESLFVNVTGAPAGSRFTAGTENADGSWTIPGDALPGFGFQPPRDYAGTLRLSFTALAAEGNGDTASTAPVEMSVTVRPVTDAPLLALADATGLEDRPLALSIATAPGDADGSESLLRVLVQGVPGGATLSAGSRAANGIWTLSPGQLAGLTLTPPAHFSGPLQLTVTAVGAESATGAEASTTGSMTLEVVPVADAPALVVANASGTEDQSLALPLAAALVDRDGSERLLDLQVSGLPEGFLLSAGTPAGGGTWTVPAASLSGLRLTPAPDWNGTLHLTVTATSEEIANGARASSSRDITVSIAAVNDAPTLVLSPADHAGQAGTPGTALLGEAHAADIDSPRLDGAVVTLGGAQAGDTLGFDGYPLHVADGRTMIGDTGIELVNGGYDAASGQLTLLGAAAPEVYSAVLQSLVLENAGPEGLAAGSRSVTVTVRDSEGAEAVQQSVTLAVEPPPPPPPPEPMPEADPQAVVEASVLAAQDVFIGHAAATGWTDHVHAGPHHWADVQAADAAIDLASPVTHAAVPGEDFHLFHGMADRQH